MSEKEKIPLTIYVDEQTGKEFESLQKKEGKYKMPFGGELLKKGIQFYKAEKKEQV